MTKNEMLNKIKDEACEKYETYYYIKLSTAVKLGLAGCGYAIAERTLDKINDVSKAAIAWYEACRIRDMLGIEDEHDITDISQKRMAAYWRYTQYGDKIPDGLI